MNKEQVFQIFDLHLEKRNGEEMFLATSPIDGKELGWIRQTLSQEVDEKIEKAQNCFRGWRLVPPPERGELIRLFGEELRDHKHALGTLVTLESGKILQEVLGEVQEMIDMCDFSLGLSRQLYGL